MFENFKSITIEGGYFEIPTTLDCIQKEDIPTMARLAEKEGNPLYPVPVLWDAKELESLYYTVLKED